MKDAAADDGGVAEVGLRSRWIRHHPVVADPLDDLDPPSSMMFSSAVRCGEDATSVGGGSLDLEKTDVVVILPGSDRPTAPCQRRRRTAAMDAAPSGDDGAP
ncbi:hypothetical protein ACLOJK_026293 [Asimina triloba]